MIKYIDLFAGIGGFHYGLDNCEELKRQKRTRVPQHLSSIGDSTDSQTKSRKNNNDFICVYSNEWDKYANSIYKKHFGECDIRDIREVKAEEIPDHDLLCGGFPCQSFSIAGKRRGFEDTRGTLFFEIARILKQKQPRLLLLENVKGLLSHDQGKTFTTIISTLDELGYDCQWQVLNSKNFGVPQNRERVFIIGNLRETSRPQVFPIGGTDTKDIKENSSQTSNTLTASYYRGPAAGRPLIQINKGESQGNRVYNPEGINTALASNAGGLGAKTGLYAIPVLTPDRPNKRQNGRRFKTNGEPSFTLTKQDKHGVFDGVKIRRLTPTECERLQGFPDGWTEGLSDTQRYKCMGNAVTTNVITEIGKRLLTANLKLIHNELI